MQRRGVTCNSDAATELQDFFYPVCDSNRLSRAVDQIRFVRDERVLVDRPRLGNRLIHEALESFRQVQETALRPSLADAPCVGANPVDARSELLAGLVNEVLRVVEEFPDAELETTTRARLKSILADGASLNEVPAVRQYQSALIDLDPSLAATGLFFLFDGEVQRTISQFWEDVQNESRSEIAGRHRQLLDDFASLREHYLDGGARRLRHPAAATGQFHRYGASLWEFAKYWSDLEFLAERRTLLRMATEALATGIHHALEDRRRPLDVLPGSTRSLEFYQAELLAWIGEYDVELARLGDYGELIDFASPFVAGFEPLGKSLSRDGTCIISAHLSQAYAAQMVPDLFSAERYLKESLECP